MSPDEIKALRRELSCTARELAVALALEQKTVMAWETGELFPTKQYVDAMEALRAKGPSAIPRKSRDGTSAASPQRGQHKADDPVKALADPAVWQLVRKIAAHKKLREAVVKLAAAYPDPAEE